MNMVVDAGFRAVWVPETQDFGVLSPGSTSQPVVAYVGGTSEDGLMIAGGTPPYTIEGIIFVGGPPAAQVTIPQSTTNITGDTIEIKLGATPSGSYNGTIRATISDSSAPVNVITADLIYSFDVVDAAVNTAFQSMLALNPSHFYPMDDLINVSALDEFRDVGDGDIPLNPPVSFSDSKAVVYMPGPARGSPRMPAGWFGRDTDINRLRAADGPVHTGWTTGAFMCWCFLPELGTLPAVGESVLIAQELNNNSGLWGGIAVDSAGRFFCEVTFNNNPRLKYQSNVGLILPMAWHHVAAVQRADATGIHLYIDGVEVTANLANMVNTTADGWFGDILEASESSRVTSVPTVDGGNPFRCSIAHPASWRNRVLSSAEILAYYNSVADSFNADPVDYFDAHKSDVLEPDPLKLRYWFEGNNQATPGPTTEQGYISTTSNDDRLQGSGPATPPSEVQQLAPYPVTGYRADRATIYGTNDPTYFVATGEFRSEDDEEDIGTLNAWVKIESITPDGSARLYMGMGRAGFEWIEIGVEGDRFFCEVQNNSQANRYRREVSALAPQSARVEVGDYYMLTVTQAADGNGFNLYINGALISGGDAVDTLAGTADVDFWLKDIGATAPPPTSSQWGLRIGGRGGSQSVNNWEPNELISWNWLDRVLGSSEILRLYEQGIPTTPDFDGYIAANLTGRRHDYLFNEASGSIIDSGSSPVNVTAITGTPLYEEFGYQPATPGQIGVEFNHGVFAEETGLAANYWGDDVSGSLVWFGYIADAVNNANAANPWSAFNSPGGSAVDGVSFFLLPLVDKIGFFLGSTIGNNAIYNFEIPGGFVGNLYNRFLLFNFVQRADGGGVRCFLNGTELVFKSTAFNGTFDVDSWFSEVGDPDEVAINENTSTVVADFTTASRFLRMFTTGVALSSAQIAAFFEASGVDAFVVPAFPPGTDFESTVLDSISVLPTIWLSCNQSGPTINNRGTSGASHDSTMVAYDAAFNGSWLAGSGLPYENGDPATPAGWGAIKFNGEGMLQTANDITGSYGTLFFVVDLTGIASSEYIFGVSRSFDIDGCFVRLVSVGGGFGAVQWAVQNASTGDSQRNSTITLPIGGLVTIAIRKGDNSAFPELFINGVEASPYSDVIGTAPVDYFFNDFNPDTNGLGARAGVASSANHFTGLMDEFLYYEDRALNTQEILALHDAALNDIGTPLDTIERYLTSLNPTHRYRLNDHVGGADFGSAGTRVDCDGVVGTPTYRVAGPDDSTKSITFVSTSYIRNTANAWGPLAKGSTVLAFVKTLSNGASVLTLSNTTNERNTLTFGSNPFAAGTSNRIGMGATLATFGNRRIIEGSTDMSTWAADGLWHLIAFINDGSALRINVDGVEETVNEITSGTPPASNVWFDDLDEANSRAVMANTRFSTGSGNNTGQQSEVCILENVELSAAQCLALFNLITN